MASGSHSPLRDHETQRRFDVLVVGDINFDIVVQGSDLTPAFGQKEKLVDDISLTVGGSAGICACGLARLGLATAIAGSVGGDALGGLLLTALAQRGVDVSACRQDSGIPTGATVILSRRTDRAMLTSLGAMARLQPTAIPDQLVNQARHLHVGSYFLLTSAQSELPSLFQRARSAGLTTSIDTNWDPAEQWDGNLVELLKLTDILFPNEEEICRIASEDDPIDAARKLIIGAGDNSRLKVAIKQGEAGALLVSEAGVLQRPALPIRAVDTIGAGDAFDAGFLFGWLAGWPLDRCLEIAISCGSLSTREVGGIEAQPSLAEAGATLPALEQRLEG